MFSSNTASSLKKSRGLLFALPTLLLGGALLTGCPVYTGEGEPAAMCDDDDDCLGATHCDDGECVDGRRCDEDDECPDNMICDDRVCEPGTRCREDDECGDDAICRDSRCVPGSRDCRTDGDCPSGEYCSEMMCTAGTDCTDSSMCDDGFICDFRNTCVPNPEGACRSHADCDAEELCIEGRCRDLEDTCKFDRQCGGNSCVNNICTPTCSASGSDECASGQLCQGLGGTENGFCAPNHSECSTSADCSDGRSCVDGRCLQDCSSSPLCGDNEYCGEDGFCRPDWRRRDQCTPETVEEDCAADRICLNGECRVACETVEESSDACRSFDDALTECAFDDTHSMNLCIGSNEPTPECRIQADCDAGENCFNADCRN